MKKRVLSALLAAALTLSLACPWLAVTSSNPKAFPVRSSDILWLIRNEPRLFRWVSYL